MGGKASKSWEEAQYDEDDEDDQRGGRPKGRQWKAKVPEHKDETTEDAPVGARAKGGKRGGDKADGGGKVDNDQVSSTTVEKPERPPPGSRRMGKKGVRS